MPEEYVQLTIDGTPVSVPRGTTLLEAAREAGIEIPVLCYFAHTTANGLCRLCAVEVEGSRVLQAACVAEAQDGAVVHTRSEKVVRARRTILEMLASTVDLSESPEIQSLVVEYECHPERFDGGKRRDIPLIDDNPVYVRDYSQCVLCWRCVQVCAEDAQYSYAINFGGRGFNTHIATFFDKPLTETTCVFCGNCVGVCPTGALKSKREYLLEQGVPPEEVFERTRVKGKRAKGGPHLDRQYREPAAD
ncbi:MAG: Fe-S-binding domain-containing protein [Anaerolineae bacterium]|nr:MAG: Fe-S-binding domain-containing protein [Anaerolineae bacterium]